MTSSKRRQAALDRLNALPGFSTSLLAASDLDVGTATAAATTAACLLGGLPLEDRAERVERLASKFEQLFVLTAASRDS